MVSWIRLDDQFVDHPKIVGLSDSAFRLYIGGISYASRQLTDGILKRAVIKTLVGIRYPVKAARELVNAGLWEVCDDGWRIHDYLDYQPSAAEIKEKRRKRAASGARGGRQKSSSGAKQNGSNLLGVCLEHDRSKTEATANPIPSHPIPSQGGGEELQPWSGNEISSIDQLLQAVAKWGWVLPTAVKASDRGKCKRILDAGPVSTPEWQYAKGVTEDRCKTTTQRLAYFLSVIEGERQSYETSASQSSPNPKPDEPRGRGWQLYKKEEQP
jgi:hypothetical protein